MKKKKIAFVVTSITDNGVTKVLSILLDEIDYTKYDVTVLLTRKRPYKRKLNSKAKIIDAQEKETGGIIGKIRGIIQIRNKIKKGKFETIIILGNYAAIYTLLASIGLSVKKIISERNDPNNEPNKKVYRILRDLIYHQADVIVCQTQDASQYYKNIVKNRLVIHNPINQDLPLYRGERTKRVVNFCRIDKQKNLHLLIDAFFEFHSTHNEFILEIYGDGPLKADLEKYIAERNLEGCVKLYGFCLDIHDKIMDATMFVSSSDFEGMSNSMLEAMAIGLPVICTDCPIGGAREIIKSEENGILVAVGNKQELVQAMNLVADKPELAALIAENGINIRKTLSKEMICAQWWKLLDESD